MLVSSLSQKPTRTTVAWHVQAVGSSISVNIQIHEVVSGLCSATFIACLHTPFVYITGLHKEPLGLFGQHQLSQAT